MGLLSGGSVLRNQGGAADSVSVSDMTVHGATQTIAGCYSGIRLNNDGSIDRITDGTGTTFTKLGDDQHGYHANGDVTDGSEVNHDGQWWTGEPDAAIGELYQFRVQTIDAGSLNGFNDFGTGTYGDIDLAPKIATTRDGGKGGAGLGTTTATVTCQIRLKASPFTVLATFEVITQSHRGGTPV